MTKLRLELKRVLRVEVRVAGEAGAALAELTVDLQGGKAEVGIQGATYEVIVHGFEPLTSYTTEPAVEACLVLAVEVVATKISQAIRWTARFRWNHKCSSFPGTARTMALVRAALRRYLSPVR